MYPAPAMVDLSGAVERYTSRDTWLEARRQGIGASDAAAVLGVSPWQTPFTLFCEKLGLEAPPTDEGEALEWGLALEPIIAARYTRETRRAVTRSADLDILRHPTLPFLFATLDGLVVGREDEPDVRRRPGVLEIKTSSIFKRDEWDEGPPLYYQVQVQHALMVTGLAWASLAVLIGGQRFLWTDVERNDRFIAALLEREREFWDRLQRRDPPPIDATDATRELLRQLYPVEESGKVVALPPEADEWDRARLDAIEASKAAEERRALAENHLRAALGDAEVGVLSTGVRYTYKRQHRKGYTVDASEHRVLRRQAK